MAEVKKFPILGPGTGLRDVKPQNPEKLVCFPKKNLEIYIKILFLPFYCYSKSMFSERKASEEFLRKYPDALELRKKVEDMGGTSLLNVDATKLHKVLLGFEGKMAGEDENKVSETGLEVRCRLHELMYTVV